MPVVKEVREFFLRATVVNTGVKKDQQVGYTTNIQVLDCEGNLVLRKNRFLKNHFPSEDVFRKLFESIAFKLNPEDTADTDNQGLVRIAIGSNIINRLDSETNTIGNYTTVVVPSELPIVTAGTDISIDIVIHKSSDNSIVTSIPPDSRELYYLEYVINNTMTVTPAIDNINNTLFKINSTVSGDVDPEDSNLKIVADAVIAEGSLKRNGDYVDIEWIIDHQVVNVLGQVYLIIGKNILRSTNESFALHQDEGPYTNDRLIKLKIRIIRNTKQGFFLKVAIQTYRGTTGQLGTSNIGTAIIQYSGNETLESATDFEPEEQSFFYVKADPSAAILWDTDKTYIAFGIKNADTSSDNHFIELRTITD